ncbi:heme exporter protein CcmB [Achromobacter sp. F4_2707]|uniref:heme exporter protein CcmB n=1 Tax=Achromobacter sp. F4_2707 TaxID=3114286 RepID=UPI0039C5AF37
MKTGLSIFHSLLCRDLSLAWRHRLNSAMGLVFFVVVATLFPLAVEPRPELLRQAGVAVLMMAGLLANLLTLRALFEDDWRDGSLAQLMLLPVPAVVMVWAKMLAHWVTIGIPLTLVAPLLAMQFQLEGAQILYVTLALAVTMPVLTAIGAVAAALTLGLPQAGLLLALLHLPLCVPVLVFASQAATNQTGSAEWWLLAALLLGSWFFAPPAAAAALRLATE